MAREPDVLVVGGGPAGLAAAIACRTRGFRVAVVDAARPPIDKSCGEGLMPDALAALERLGVRLDAGHGFPFRGIRFRGYGAVVDASFPEGRAIGVRRTVLHELLCEQAEVAGVELRWGTPVAGIANLRCKWLIGADGQNSRVRRWAGLDGCRHESRRFGFRRHYRIAPWTDCVEIHWGRGCQIYVTPVGQDEVGIALISRDSMLRLDEALIGFPELSERLRGAAHTSVEKGAVTATRRLRRVTKGNVALVGDASGSVDAITAEGLCLSFLQALNLSEALSRGRLEEYESGHAHLMRRPRMMCDLMLLLDRAAWLRQRVLPAMAARPEIFANMLAMHVGAVKPANFLMNAILPLGWRMLYAPKTTVLLWLCVAAQAKEATVEIDPVKSTVQFTLTDVLHTVHGTFRVKSGTVRFNLETGEASGRIVVNVASGDSGGGARDRRMHLEILQSDRYPEAIFTVDRVTGLLPALAVHGVLRIHGQDHEVTFAGNVTIRDGRVTGRTTFTMPYVIWGMKDPSIFMLRVNDKVQLDIAIEGAVR